MAYEQPLAALGSGTRRQILERQGHGRTVDIDRSLTFEQNADDVAALLKHLQIEKADFFGESFGGIVAMLIATRHPTLVRRVAIYGTALRTESLAAFAQLTPDHRSVQYQRETYQRLAPNPARWPVLFAKSGQMSMAWQGFPSETLKSIQVPVLIAASDQDFLSPVLKHHLEMFRLIPNAQLVVIIPDAGHFVLNEDPEKLLPGVATFLDRPTSTVPFATTLSGYHPGET